MTIIKHLSLSVVKKKRYIEKTCGRIKITLDNIIDLKNFINLKESGLTLLNEFLQSFMNCKVRMQQLPIEKFEKQINLDENEANKLYEIVMRIIGTEIKNKLKHPFKSQD